MADIQQLENALIKADAAGNADDARALAAEIRRMRGTEQPAQAPVKTIADDAKQFGKDVIGGLARGAAGVGNTLLEAVPVVAVKRAISGQSPLEAIQQRNQTAESTLSGMGADPESIPFAGGKLGYEMAATAGIGPAIGGIKGLAQAAPRLAQALSTGGMRTGSVPVTLGEKAADLGIRTVGGAVTGGASTALVSPEDAAYGTAIGGAAPGVLKGVGAVAGGTGSLARKALKADVSPEVAKLAERAKELGINIPADRLVNSRALNATSAALNYVPFSGRAASEDLMNSQLNKALSKTFGQDSSNVTMALRKADDQLGAQFDHVLKNNGVKFDDKLMNDVVEVYKKAESELGADALKPITAKIDTLMEKSQSGVIDGQAAYNIKRDLDRLGRGNTPTAYHALELKGKLMEALDRSLGPDQAAKFAKTRKQYGNMLALEKLATAGAEGEISAARLANMKNINNPELQELADIAAQFVKPREGAHGAAQRAAAGAITLGMGGLPALATGAAVGRTANAALNSETLKKLMLRQGTIKPLNPEVQQLIYRSAPLVGSQ